MEGDSGGESKYFLEEHKKLFAKMIPPAGAAGSEGKGVLETIPVLADLTKMGGNIDGKQFAQMIYAGYINLEGNMKRFLAHALSVLELLIELRLVEVHWPIAIDHARL